MVDLRKEKEPVAGTERVRVAEEVPTVEAPKNSQENLENLSFLEKMEKRFSRVPNQTSDVTDDSVVVEPIANDVSKQPPITLPVNQQQIIKGKKANSDLGIAWLVTWAIRQIKMLTKTHRKVKLADLPEKK
ncbi:MAG: hypothetical protein WCG44_00895 [bacterium]